jgi:GTP cyclohydrolase I
MRAYDNPAFVEDVVRNAAVALRRDVRVTWFRVHAVNFESIHNHNAFARIEWTRPHETAAGLQPKQGSVG